MHVRDEYVERGNTVVICTSVEQTIGALRKKLAYLLKISGGAES